ncbi:Extracellular ribonuclease [Peribacillus sp. Bi96]|uniref:endonuclease n=1 Tax=Peribacillus sp. Bi96 TaxID=2884273 RepID=UPI001D1C83F4|nr:endonuclease [Peribacillus sp. Bi96]CAH0234316.1 Extracellular ribonuclease [Peribacillus sp. Bi96]
MKKNGISKLFFAILFVLSTILPYAADAKAEGTITVAEAINNNSGTATVKGYIVGTAKSGTSYQQTSPFTESTNIGIADNPDETDVKKIMPVQLPSGNIRTSLNLVDHSELLKAQVTITGKLEKYFSVPGLKSATDYTIISDGGTPPEQPDVKVLESIAEARTNTEDVVQVDGVVTTGLGFWGGKGFYIQDETAGLYVYASSWPADVKQGDEVRLIGQVSAYNKELQIQPTSLEVVSSGNELPEIQKVDASGVNGDTQGELVTIEEATITGLEASGTYGTFEFKATDAKGNSVIVRHDNRNGSNYDDFLKSFKEGDVISVTGIASQFNDTYQLKPRGIEDYELVNKPAVYTDIFPGTVSENTKVSLESGWKEAKIHYTLDGSTPTSSSTLYTEPIVLMKDTVIKAIAVNDKTSEVFTFAYTVTKTNELKIRDIQGMNHFSSYENQLVSDVEGVVTYVKDANNFYMQDPNPDKDLTTSEGILVYSKVHGLKAGDHVKVAGKVVEWYIEGYSEMKMTDLPTTELTNTTIEKLGTKEIPKPIVIGKDVTPPSENIDDDRLTDFNPNEDGIDFYESLEGMLVQVYNPKVVAPQDYGELVVIPGNMETTTAVQGVKITETDFNPERITLDLDDESFVAKTGDSFEGPVSGVISYGYSNYRVLTNKNQLPTLKDGGTAREVTFLEKDSDKLSIASYNIENFSTQTANAKVETIATSIITNLKQPDIIGVTEMQDNDGATDSGTTDSAQSAKKLTDKIKALGGPQYQFIDIAPEDKLDGGAPGGNIRVGFLYNVDRVKLTEGTKGTATQSVAFKDGKLTLNPGRIEPTNSAFTSSRKPLAAQFEFKGESVVVVANHFNSKGGDQPLFGKNQPPVLSSETQRLKIASIVNGFVSDIKSQDAKANIVLLGDFNDYEFSAPLKTLKGKDLTNMIEKVPFEKRYSYTYQGNSQVLDHILVSNNMAAATKVDIVHINSSFMEVHGRASDHDPVLIQTALTESGGVEPVAPDKTYHLTNVKTKKLTIDSPSALIDLDETSKIEEGILLKGSYAVLKGLGLKDVTVTIKPDKEGAVIDFGGMAVKEVIIDNANVKEIRGAENVQKWSVTEGVDTKNIKFFDSKGEAIASPFDTRENQAPIVTKNLANLEVKVGSKVTIDLSEHVTDPDGDPLTFSSTIGTVVGSTLTLPTNEAGTYLVAVKAEDKQSEVVARFTLTVSNDMQLESYYESATGKTGTELKSVLYSIIKGHTMLSYDQVWNALKETDEDPDNSNNVILLYSGKSISKNSNGGNAGQWNREHVWAKSHGDFGTSKGPGTDLHHLRPADVSVNGKRGHLDFDEGGQTYSGCACKFDADSWEPPDQVKGDIARMIFYMAVRYEGNGELDLELSDTVNTYPKPLHGKLSTLLKWNDLDPVDDFESHRNDVIYDWQNNRNPFIDHPEWASEIWGAAKSNDEKKAS